MRTLYHSPLLPSCRKIRLVLKEKDIVFEPWVENFWERRPEFVALNPAGEMPVLVEENGLILSGSYAIAEYLEEIAPEKSLIGHTAAERAEVRRLVEWFDDRFNQEVTRNILHEKLFKRLLHKGGPDSRAIREGKENIFYHLEYIENLARARHWLAGEHLSLADITAAAHLSSLDYLGDVPWEHSPKAREWYALMKSRPSFRNILADRISAFSPPAHYDNPDF